MQTTWIDLIRHGEPEGGNVFRGRTDVVLTARGQAQFDCRIARHQTAWQAIYSSPLQRCRASAETLAEQLALPCVLRPEWQEMDFGDWENRLVSDIYAEHGEHAQRLWQDPLSFCAPNGESVPDFQQRILNAWQDLLLQHRGERVLVVCHGGVLRVLLQQLLDMPAIAMNRFALPYASFVRLRVDHSDDDAAPSDWLSLALLDGNELTDQELSL